MKNLKDLKIIDASMDVCILVVLQMQLLANRIPLYEAESLLAWPETDPDSLTTVSQAPSPNDLQTFCPFLGLTAYFVKQIPKYASHTLITQSYIADNLQLPYAIN